MRDLVDRALDAHADENRRQRYRTRTAALHHADGIAICPMRDIAVVDTEDGRRPCITGEEWLVSDASLAIEEVR